MCGINGIFHYQNRGNYSSIIATMNNALIHRGPDDDGTYSDEQITLGHRRLAIIDLSKDGRQPFHSYDNRYIIVYNGELYNYREIKLELKDYPFTTNTDTEVLLASYIKWGKACLERFNGMFAFAIWDKERGELFIARDRLGIKPLYYSNNSTHLIFSSELRALLSSGLVPKKLNKSVLSNYLQYQTVHAPETIVEDVKMLLPGYFIFCKNGNTEIQQYWNPALMFNPEIHSKSKATVKQEIKELFYKSVERRLIADVPFGAFLSGGIDSSAIVGTMSEISSKPVETFSVTFDEQEFSEAEYSNRIARLFHTNHHQINLKISDFIEEMPNALLAMDHPGGDGPNTYLVSKVTKNAGITMALSGLGGDELFAGYSIFKQSMDIRSKNYLNNIPVQIRALIGNSLGLFKKGVSSKKIAEILSLKKITPEHIYPVFRKALLDEQIKNMLAIKNQNGNRVEEIINAQFKSLPVDYPLLSKITLSEINTYMQNVLLRDSDQMSMASALEVRVPFLDHTLVEYVLSVSDEVKYPKSQKQLLTESLGGLVPEDIINRPKMGFVFPWEHWLKNELKDFCSSHIENLEKREIFNKGSMRELWQAFLNNDPNITWSRVWPVIVLENWMQLNNIES